MERITNLDEDVAPEEPLLHIPRVNPFILPEESREVIMGNEDLKVLDPISRSTRTGISSAGP